MRPCHDCPWMEPGCREDMIDLKEQGETLWPCHHTSDFSGDRAVPTPNSKPCVGHLQYEKDLNQ